MSEGYKKIIFLLIRILGGIVGAILLLVVVIGAWFNPDYMFTGSPPIDLETVIIDGLLIVFGLLMVTPYSLIKNKYIYYCLFFSLSILVLLLLSLVAVGILNSPQGLGLPLVNKLITIGILFVIIANPYVVYSTGKYKFKKLL